MGEPSSYTALAMVNKNSSTARYSLLSSIPDAVARTADCAWLGAGVLLDGFERSTRD
jgi:hypothetical protein